MIRKLKKFIAKDRDVSASTFPLELKLDRLIQQIFLAIVILALSLFIIFKFIEVNKVYRLDFAAGDPHSESYILS